MRKKLYIFDLDNTLVYFDKDVVVKDGNYNVKEYKDAHYFSSIAKPIKSMIDWLCKIDITNDIHILTARSDFENNEIFIEFMKKLGAPMDNITVHFAGNNYPRLNTSQSKAEIITNIIKENNYEIVLFFDDIKENLDAANNAVYKMNLQTDLHCFLVTYDKSTETVTQEFYVN